LPGRVDARNVRSLLIRKLITAPKDVSGNQSAVPPAYGTRGEWYMRSRAGSPASRGCTTRSRWRPRLHLGRYLGCLDHRAAAFGDDAGYQHSLGQLHDRHQQRHGLPDRFGAHAGRTRTGQPHRPLDSRGQAGRVLCRAALGRADRRETANSRTGARRAWCLPPASDRARRAPPQRRALRFSGYELLEQNSPPCLSKGAGFRLDVEVDAQNGSRAEERISKRCGFGPSRHRTTAASYSGGP
jgi:hypothetical protein